MEGRYRILVVDDHVDTLDLVRMTLADRFDVLTLQNPLEVYEILQLFEPDVIILDIMMPKATGFQIIEIMQKNPVFSRIPIMILSAKDSTREIKYGYKLGAKIYLTKPFQPERLKKNVEFLLEQFVGAPRRKTLSVEAVDKQIRTSRSYKLGMASFSSSLLAPDAARQREADERKRRKQEGDERARDHWVD
jgi:DNA-binding response OmpR family regulator